MLPRWITVGVVAFSSSACGASGGGTLTPEEGSRIEVEVRGAWDSMAEALLRLDIDSALQFVDTIAPVHAVDGQFHYGVGAIGRAYRSGMAAVDTFLAFAISEEHFEALSREAASLALTFDERFVTTGGDTLVLTGVWLQVWRRRPDAWRLMHSSASHRMAAQAP